MYCEHCLMEIFLSICCAWKSGNLTKLHPASKLDLMWSNPLTCQCSVAKNVRKTSPETGQLRSPLDACHHHGFTIVHCSHTSSHIRFEFSHCILYWALIWIHVSVLQWPPPHSDVYFSCICILLEIFCNWTSSMSLTGPLNPSTRSLSQRESLCAILKWASPTMRASTLTWEPPYAKPALNPCHPSVTFAVWCPSLAFYQLVSPSHQKLPMSISRPHSVHCALTGSPAVHEKAPLIKSVMLAGPRGTGKHMLVYAICTETGANLFDLTATNIAGKYPGKDGLKLLMHMIFKVSC